MNNRATWHRRVKNMAKAEIYYTAAALTSALWLVAAFVEWGWK